MKLSTLRKYVIGFGIVVILLVVTSFLSVNYLRSSLDVTVDLINLQEVVQATNSLERALLEERIALGKYVLTGVSGQLDRIEDARNTYNQRWAVVANALEDSNPEGVAAVDDARRTYISLLENAITAYQSNPDDISAAVIFIGNLDSYSNDTLGPLLDDLDEPELARLIELTGRERTRATRLSLVYNVLSVLSLVVGVAMIVAMVFVFNFTRNVIDSVAHLIEASDAISRGDLDVPIDVSMGGDMQTLAESIERMRTSLKAAIERLRR